MNPILLPALLEAAARSLFLALLVWLGLRMLRVRNVTAQKTAWSLVLVAALLMPFLAHWHWLPVPAFRLQGVHQVSPALATAVAAAPAADASAVPAHRAAPARADESLPSAASHVAAGDRYPAPVISFGPRSTPAAHLPSSPSIFRGLRALAAQHVVLAWMFYLGISAFLLARLAVGLAFAARLWLMAEPVASTPQLPLSASMRVRASPRVASPVALGSGIVLPRDYAEWDAEKLRVVLAHEHSHLRQGDFYLQLLARLYAALFWLSPLGWWLKRKLSDLGEAISDRAGLEAAASRSSYAQVLLEFAVMPRPNLIGVSMAHSSNLSQRIERFLNESAFRSAFTLSRRRTLAAVLLVPAALLASTALVRVEAAATTPSPSVAVHPVAPAAAPLLPAPAASPAKAAVQLQPTPPAPLAATPVETVVAPLPAQTRMLVLTAMQPAAPAQPLAALVLPVAPFAAAAVSLDDDATQATFDRTLTVGAPVALSVATGSGNIQLVHGSSNTVHIHGIIRAGHEGTEEQVRAVAANPPIEQAGDVIRIGGHGDDPNLRHISISYEIEAPANATLEAATGSGDIKDDGVGQQAKLNTGSGNIHATGLHAGFKANTGSGNIVIEQSGEGDVKAQTGSGNIELKGPAGALKAQTGSGDIKITGTPTADWKLQTGSGNIELWLGATPVTLDASFGSGNFHTDREMLTQGTFDRHHITGKLGGGGPAVRMETGSGDISVH